MAPSGAFFRTKVCTFETNYGIIYIMNMFYLHPDPIVAARMQCDKHVVKMIVESAQMLSTAHRMLDGTLTMKPSKSGKRMVKYFELSNNLESVLYKAVHHNHPCTVWTRESKDNYLWHYNHFIALCDEYKYRYGKTHATDNLLREVLATPPATIPERGMTEIPLAMKSNPECMFPEDPVKSYKLYYKTKETKFNMVWTNRPIPEFMHAV